MQTGMRMANKPHQHHWAKCCMDTPIPPAPHLPPPAPGLRPHPAAVWGGFSAHAGHWYHGHEGWCELQQTPTNHGAVMQEEPSGEGVPASCPGAHCCHTSLSLTVCWVSRQPGASCHGASIAASHKAPVLQDSPCGCR